MKDKETSKERIWLVSEVFYPDTDIATGNIATEIAVKFSEQYEVHVICGPQDYDSKIGNSAVKELPANMIIHRWKHFNYNKNQSLKRLVRVLGISFGLFVKGFKIKKNEKVFVISNPAFITPLYACLKWIKRFQFILLMHDVFPENLVTGGYIGSNNILYRLCKVFFERSRRSADKIIVIGRDMKALLLQTFPASRTSDIVIIPNWADIEIIFPQPFRENEIVRNLQLEKKIVILFAGNHGVLQHLTAFLQVVKKINNPMVHFLFAGGGAEKKSLENFAQQNALDHVHFLPPFPRSDLNKVLNASHIGLVSLTDALFGVGVPSKSYNILAAGKPILFVGNSATEIPQFVMENNIGWAFNYADVDELIRFLNGLTPGSLNSINEKGRRGYEIVVKDYCRQEVLDKMCRFVSNEKLC